MTGGGFALPAADDYSDDDGDRLELSELGQTRRREVEWVGKPSVVGPEWMKMPLLTVCMLGLQCVWSIEMGYASPYLLELGLSKSLMSLVFVAGPLSGLIMQPLIGVLADRSKSRFGRRRPFMIAGCVVSVVAMMLLGWAREIAGFFGGGKIFSIMIAVWAIYLIDFSINAVQAVDRALVVDTLPPSQQEKGNAWAGRMFGTGSLAGFWVGNINLLSIFPFLGKTQLQVLSFLTSVVLMAAHGVTAYSVKERVLLRDNRQSSKGSTMDTIKSIWTNIFLLPPAIRSICYAQFFAWIGWFPILFYTSVWVGEIYIREAVGNGRAEDDPELAADATRAGSRALFLNACVNLFTSVFLPFLVSSSGIRPPTTDRAVKLGSAPSRGPVYALLDRVVDQLDRVRSLVHLPKRLRVELPLPWLSLIRVWAIGQFVFCFTMFATWLAGSVFWANAIIALNGFCWAVAQWAPFSLLGELILLDSNPNAPISPTAPTIRMSVDRARRSRDDTSERIQMALQDQEDEETLFDEREERKETPFRPTHSRGLSSSTDLGRGSESRSRTPNGHKYSDGGERRVSSEGGGAGNGHAEPGRSQGGQSTAEKAGVILGIHNIFIVIPQFLVTFLSAIIFYLMEPTRPSLPGSHSNPHAPIHGNGTLADSDGLDGSEAFIGDDEGGIIQRNARLLARATVHALVHDRSRRELEAHVTGGPDSVGLVFRLGGISAAIAGFMCLRLSRQWIREYKTAVAYETYDPVSAEGPRDAPEDFPSAPRSGIHLGLDNMKTLLSHLPPVSIPYIHIAGTNGKGSVSAMLDSALREAGLRIGRYNSPHLIAVRDAIVINGKDASPSEYLQHRTKVEAIIKENHLDNSEFEVTTATAFTIFAASRPHLDVLIIECGMGGLRDATNVLDTSKQLCSVLTPVDLDHQAFLGTTIREIAADKLGIAARRGVMVVGKQQYQEVYSLAGMKAQDVEANLFEVDDLPEVQGEDGGEVTVALPLIGHAEGDKITAPLPLAGPYQKDNLATAVTILHVLRSHSRCLRLVSKLSQLTDQAIAEGIGKTEWRGRCSWIPLRVGGSFSNEPRQVLVDGAHNAGAASQLRQYIQSLRIPPSQPITYIIGLSHSPPKTASSILQPLLEGCRSIDRVMPVSFSLPVEGMPWIKPVAVEDVRKAAIEAGIWPENVLMPARGVEQDSSLAAALERVEEDYKGLVVVTGSLYLVADAYRLVTE